MIVFINQRYTEPGTCTQSSCFTNRRDCYLHLLGVVETSDLRYITGVQLQCTYHVSPLPGPDRPLIQDSQAGYGSCTHDIRDGGPAFCC